MIRHLYQSFFRHLVNCHFDRETLAAFVRNPLSLGLFYTQVRLEGRVPTLANAVISRAMIPSDGFVFAGQTPEAFLVGEDE